VQCIRGSQCPQNARSRSRSREPRWSLFPRAQARAAATRRHCACRRMGMLAACVSGARSPWTTHLYPITNYERTASR
jgi:hypothetical protein